MCKWKALVIVSSYISHKTCTHPTKWEVVCASKSKPHHLLLKDRRCPASLQVPRTLGQTLPLPRNHLPALVTHTYDPSVAVIASKMPVELVLWNRHRDFRGRLLEEQLLPQPLFKLLNSFLNHLFSELQGRAEGGGNSVPALDQVRREQQPSSVPVSGDT